ncbi:MAG: GDSL-type esterase/lipase family protein [Fimbriimonadaceae bacterium]
MVLHLVLLGDSVFDNQAYVATGRAVIDHVRAGLPGGAQATLLAVDGDVTTDVARQMRHLPADATHLALSVGGNDALGALPALQAPSSSVLQALDVLAALQSTFRHNYRDALLTLAEAGLPCVVCTVYDAVPGLTPALRTALSVYNDVITREALRLGLPVLDLREWLTEPTDYSSQSPIEPSDAGGYKIARALLDWSHP